MSNQPQKGKKAHRRGVIGIDEVGRGPLAGPVTVCAFYVEDEKEFKEQIFGNTVRDSKKLTKSSRDNIYLTIRYKRYLYINPIYAISSRSAAYVDAHGINKAVQACALSCVRKLSRRGLDIYNVRINLDAGLVIPIEGLKQKSFVKGDERYAEIAAASIMAKVTRDTLMERLARTHTEYGWEKNAGYGTLHHRKAIEKHGITPHHRKTYLRAFELFDKTE